MSKLFVFHQPQRITHYIYIIFFKMIATRVFQQLKPLTRTHALQLRSFSGTRSSLNSAQSLLESYKSDTTQIQKAIDQHIHNDPVFIVTKSFCPFCIRAKSMLDSYNAKYVDVEIDFMKNGNTVQDVLKEMTEQSTVPNIFIGGKHVGGE